MFTRMRMAVMISVFLMVPSVVCGFATNSQQAAHVSVRLVSDHEQVVRGASVWVAVELTMEPDWHTYYHDPGDSGMATTVRWSLPDGVSMSDLHWPEPVVFSVGDMTMNGYSGTVYLFSRMTISPHVRLESVLITATVQWLSCKEECVPGEATFSVDLPVGRERSIHESRRKLFERELSTIKKGVPL